MPKHPSTFIFELLKDSTGTSAMNTVGNTTTPIYFAYTSPSTGMYLSRINFQMADDGILPYDKFGGITALGNGCGLEVIGTDGSTRLIDFFDGTYWQRTSDITLLAGVDNPIVDSTPGTDVQPTRWTVAKAGDLMFLKTGQQIRISVRDDLTGLSRFRAMVQGIKAKDVDED